MGGSAGATAAGSSAAAHSRFAAGIFSSRSEASPTASGCATAAGETAEANGNQFTIVCEFGRESIPTDNAGGRGCFDVERIGSRGTAGERGNDEVILPPDIFPGILFYVVGFALDPVFHDARSFIENGTGGDQEIGQFAGVQRAHLIVDTDQRSR